MLEDRTTPTPVISIVKGADAYEGEQNGNAILSRTDDPNFPISQPLSVNVSISGAGTATPGQDYQYITSNVTFAAGSATATVTVNVIGSPYDDSYVEPDETVILNIAGPGANYTIGNPSSATVIIVDNDTNAHDYYWIGEGADPNWYTVGNWTLDPVNKTWASDAPHGPRDNVYFDGALFSNPDDPRENSTGSGNYSGYNSFHMVDDYRGVVSLNSVSFNTFVQDSGTIDQPSASNILDVSQNFTWTGGTLNSKQNGATVTTEGAGTITIPAAGLITGSNLNFLNPSAAAVETAISGAGTLLQNGGTGIYVGTAATVRTVLINSQVITFSGNNNKTVTLATGSVWGEEGQGSKNYSKYVFVNQGGRFYVHGIVTVTIGGGDASTPAYTQSGGSFLFRSELEIQCGCKVDVSTSKGAEINGGYVYLIGNPAVAADSQVSAIKGKFVMAGGSIVFDAAPTQIGTQNVWPEFYVDGDVVWSGGTYYPALNCAAGAPANGPVYLRNNSWVFTGTMTVTNHVPTIDPSPQLGQPPSGIWDVIIGTGGNVAAGGDPNVTDPWSLQPIVANNVKTGYSVRKF